MIGPTEINKDILLNNIAKMNEVTVLFVCPSGCFF